MPLPRIARLRLLSQQLAAPQFRDPKDVVSWFGAMQAQDLGMAKRAVAMRLRRPSARKVDRALSAGEIVRLHLFRGTWQFAAAGDVRWMNALCGPSYRRGIAAWAKANGETFRELEIRRALDAVRDALSDGLAHDAGDIARTLDRRKIPHGGRRIHFILHFADAAGLLTASSKSGPRNEYRLLDAVVPPAPPLDEDEALLRLAIRYFRSHGPATGNDFVWWSGLSVSQCCRGIAAAGDSLVRFRAAGTEWIAHRDARTRGARSAAVHLVPAYDETIVGVKTRHVHIAPEHFSKAFNAYGIFRPVVLRGGIAVATWRPAGRGTRTEPFEP